VQSVRIDRLEIHLKGIPSTVARSAVTGLDNELLDQLSKQPELLQKRHAGTIGRIDLGTMQAARGVSPSDLRRAVATRVAASLTSHTK
jgi:hypothetical protein